MRPEQAGAGVRQLRQEDGAAGRKREGRPLRHRHRRIDPVQPRTLGAVPDVQVVTRRVDKFGRRIPRKPRPVILDTMGYAKESTSELDIRNRILVLGTAQGALLALKTARDSQNAWRGLVDAFNVSEALVGQKVGENPEIRALISQAQAAMAELLEQAQATGSWTLRPHWLRAIEAGLDVFVAQVELCTFRQYNDALEKVKRVTSGALAGSPPPGTKVYTTKGLR